ncbi:MAG TPA: filamentous hemagglutinin N-terminal domain-containing protein, partial [Gammaproteobacteria bacterium]
MSHNASHNPLLRHRLRALLSRSPAMAMLGIPGLALAGPTGEDVIRGQADVARPDANNTIIKQYTDRAVINWQTFNVDADEYVIFNQLDASSIVLNRVLGGDASAILGHIEANGQVFLLNPQGVFFTHGASLDVQGFLASTLDMDPDAFMAGDFTLTRSAGAPDTARVINDGHITAGPGGYVVLAGDYTENTGIITAHAGTVALVAGNALTLDIEGDGLVSFTVDEAALSEAAGVRNAGSLIADGGRVIMTAKVASDLVATAVNNEGLVRAHSIEELGGEIYLVGHGGDVANSGTLDADGENADGGGIAIYSDRDVTLADGGVQTAAGDENHEGGVIRAIAEEHLDYQKDNLIRVTGGMSGGFVEVSGHGSIALRGIPQIGAGGTFLIDPTNINIIDGTGSGNIPIGSIGTVEDAYIERQLNLNVNVILAASSSVTAGSGVSITANTGSADLTIGIGALSGSSCTTCAGANSSFCFGPGVTFNQFGNGTIDLTGVDIDIRGDLTIQAASLDGNLIVGNVTAG